jgi:hypothetical protein
VYIYFSHNVKTFFNFGGAVQSEQKWHQSSAFHLFLLKAREKLHTQVLEQFLFDIQRFYWQ